MKRWNYKGVADITIGEIQESKVPKIILTALTILITILMGLAIYFRDYIHDIFVTPEVILRTSEVSVELNSIFDAESYIISKGEHYSIAGDAVDTSVLNAEYIVIYNTWNRVNSSSKELKVKIVDDTAPTIKLKSNNKKIKLDENNSFTLILGKSTDTTLGTKDFNVHKDILVEVNDNTTSKDDLLATLKISPENLDFTLDESEFSKNINIYYEIKDASGLTSTEHLIITIVHGVIEIPQQSSSSSSTMTSTTSSTPTISSDPIPSSSSTTSNTHSTPSYSSSTSTPNVSSTSSSKPPVVPSTPYINGVHDVTVKVGTGLQTIVNELLDGVYGSGYVTVEYRKVNPTIAGVYTVTFSSSDGVVKTCTVTVVE